METDNRVGYFFLGLGLGTAVGLLVAPKSGAESRNYLRSKTQEGTSYLKNQGEQLVNSAAVAGIGEEAPTATWRTSPISRQITSASNSSSRKDSGGMG